MGFQAHKTVLSVFSPVLKNILLDNPHSHPLIYLRGIKHKDLDSILRFIYHGEAQFFYGNINRIIQAAKDLQIPQLEEAATKENLILTSNQSINTNIEDQAQYEINSNITNNADDIDRSITIITDVITKPVIDETNSEKELYTCEECEVSFRSRSGWSKHKDGVHDGIVYSCQQCDYQAKQKSTLKTHINSVHEKLDKEFCHIMDIASSYQAKSQQYCGHNGPTAIIFMGYE